jgi:UDP:flavonoid glycosyltransferase YjiC (YdhE family)
MAFPSSATERAKINHLYRLVVGWSGAGIPLKAGVSMPEQIRDAVCTILHNPSYTERARTLGAEIAKSDALQTIARTVNATIAVTQEV